MLAVGIALREVADALGVEWGGEGGTRAITTGRLPGTRLRSLTLQRSSRTATQTEVAAITSGDRLVANNNS